MSDKDSPRYTMRLYLYDDDDIYIDDIISFTIIKMPIIRMASYAILTLNMATFEYIQIKEQLQVGQHAKIKIKIWQVDIGSIITKIEEDNLNKLLMKKELIVLHTQDIETLELEKDYIKCSLYLVNPVLYWLNNYNSYNKVFTNKKAIDILRDYEGWLTSEHQDVFDFIGNYKNINSHIYDQVLVKCENDLNIPNYLIYDKKILKNAFSYYFFDSFYSKQSTKKDITGIFNMLSICSCTQCDIRTEYTADLQYGGDIIQTNIISDPFNRITRIFDCDKELPQVHTYESYDMNVQKMRDIVTPIDVIKGTGSINEEDIYEDRTIQVSDYKYDTHSKKLKTKISLYVPDSIDNADNRFKAMRRELGSEMNQIVEYRFNNCHFEFIQIGDKCNLDQSESNKNKFANIVIALINNFKRIETTIPVLSQSTTGQFLEYNV
jgi:hypothetical protein